MKGHAGDLISKHEIVIRAIDGQPSTRVQVVSSDATRSESALSPVGGGDNNTSWRSGPDGRTPNKRVSVHTSDRPRSFSGNARHASATEAIGRSSKLSVSRIASPRRV
jgi:hypothetical protein